jgi:hypothetical protein
MVASDTLKAPCGLDEGGTASFFVVLLYYQQIPRDVSSENCFVAVYQEVWRLSRWLGGFSTQPPERLG